MNDRIRAGDLRESVTIESSTEQTNSFGEMIVTWAPIATRRASIKGRRTDERVDSTMPYTVASHEVTFRYTPELRPDMRLIWTNNSPPRILDILAITDLSRNEGHVVTCKEHSQ